MSELQMERPTSPRPLVRRSWLQDFSWEEGRLVIRKTGISLRLNGALFNEIWNWALYLPVLYCAAFLRRLTKRPTVRLRFAPDSPRPWYLIRGAAMWAGIDFAAPGGQADCEIYFDDTTVGDAPDSLCNVRLNHRCTDISKSHVARVFEDVFGYPLAIDPLTSFGEIVEKPEQNGVHGGRVITAPCTPRAGFVYQHLIDTRDTNECCRDLRTCWAGTEPALVWVKVKTPDGRFSINNQRAFLTKPSAVYSEPELKLISKFASAMGLDWGGLDILRDNNDGRIYIVDVNKTELGPLIALSWSDKIRSMTLLARALTRLVAREPNCQTSSEMVRDKAFRHGRWWA